MNDPIINRTEKTGYPYPLGPYIFERLVQNPCGCPRNLEVVIKLNGVPLCPKCAGENGIKIL